MQDSKVIHDKLFIGMDLHRKTSSFCVKDRDGNLVQKIKIPTDKELIGTFINQFSSPLSLVLEPVSQWYVYADFFQEKGIDVHLAHPLRVKAIASARIKTDSIDASVLCDLLRSNLLPEAYFSSKEVRSWKELVRFRSSLLNLRTQTKNRIHSILHKHALVHDFSDLFGVGGMKWLKSLELPEPFGTSLKAYMDLLEYLEDQIQEAETRIETTISDHPQATLLTTIPGIRYVTALTIAGEIGDIHRFRSPEKLMGYAGLVPSTYASGDTVRHGRITKTGSKWLRTAMIEVAHHQQLCTKKPGFRWYYLKLKARKGSKPAAVATARKMCSVVWRILTDNRPFEARPPESQGNEQMRAESYSP